MNCPEKLCRFGAVLLLALALAGCASPLPAPIETDAQFDARMDREAAELMPYIVTNRAKYRAAREAD